MVLEVYNLEEMVEFGKKLGQILVGGEIIELIGDVGAGKTTLVKGIAKGLGITDPVQSPSYNINRTYQCRKNGLELSHYDFYRIEQIGVLGDELDEELDDDNKILIIEWSDAAKNVLPEDRMIVRITTIGDTARQLEILASGNDSQKIIDKMEE